MSSSLAHIIKHRNVICQGVAILCLEKFAGRCKVYSLRILVPRSNGTALLKTLSESTRNFIKSSEVTDYYLNTIYERWRWANAGTPPAGIILGKGAVHITVNRHFVDYILHNQTAQAFLNWCRNASVPDETIFASLNHNAHLAIPGPANGYVKPYIKNSRYKNWGTQPCAGRMVRSICIFGIGDLPVLSKRKELFANKFYMNYQPFTFDCMEELIYNRTKEGYFKKMDATLL
ncbi:Beta-1,3-galactosyl-O-glycosyl-glycoprotein beta-1,6-N-acetylglucosaminyltransferase [Mizuhopecten yessoensis]|uniref:Beta-1,3-galactosyl-O-glycosyl-glycoprotein beta-1,6-N-acetylglucosaminyltransferase n=1 Tax=Mizuhopecten yessoensis TaxID=6573 RepID=A0A210QRX1_MIZYE|nr:Beta-1,3-galactosyl-O-glycosyl-glycoprotein beta-1,6-N-acetylglucosaminyltransferase [Mizuhopecten yessoensis]